MASQFTSQALSNYFSQVSALDQASESQQESQQEQKDLFEQMGLEATVPGLTGLVQTGMRVAERVQNFRAKAVLAKKAIQEAPEKARAVIDSIKNAPNKADAILGNVKGVLKDAIASQLNMSKGDLKTHIKNMTNDVRSHADALKGKLVEAGQTAEDFKKQYDDKIGSIQDAKTKMLNVLETQYNESGLKAKLDENTKSISELQGKLSGAFDDQKSAINSKISSLMGENERANIVLNHASNLREKINNTVSDSVDSISSQYNEASKSMKSAVPTGGTNVLNEKYDGKSGKSPSVTNNVSESPAEPPTSRMSASQQDNLRRKAPSAEELQNKTSQRMESNFDQDPEDLEIRADKPTQSNLTQKVKYTGKTTPLSSQPVENTKSQAPVEDTEPMKTYRGNWVASVPPPSANRPNRQYVSSEDGSVQPISSNAAGKARYIPPDKNTVPVNRSSAIDAKYRQAMAEGSIAPESNASGRAKYVRAPDEGPAPPVNTNTSRVAMNDVYEGAKTVAGTAGDAIGLALDGEALKAGGATAKIAGANIASTASNIVGKGISTIAPALTETVGAATGALGSAVAGLNIATAIEGFKEKGLSTADRVSQGINLYQGTKGATESVMGVARGPVGDAVKKAISGARNGVETAENIGEEVKGTVGSTVADTVAENATKEVAENTGKQVGEKVAENIGEKVGEGVAEDGVLDSAVASIGPIGDVIDAGLMLWQTITGIKDLMHGPPAPIIQATVQPSFQAGI